MDRIAQRLGDHWLARAKNLAAGRGIDRNPLAHNLGGMHPHRRRDNQRVDFVNGQVGVDGNQHDRLLGFG